MSEMAEAIRELIEQRGYTEESVRLTIENALKDYSDQWAWIVDSLFKPKCEVFGYCDEKNSCGRMPRKEDK